MLDWLFGNRRRNSVHAPKRAGNRRIIEFSVVPTMTPGEVLIYLGQLGISAKTHRFSWHDDGSRTASVTVKPQQYLYAAGLVAGMKPGSVSVLDPHGVKPIKPRSRWGVANHDKGIVTASIRSVGNWLMPVHVDVPPVVERKQKKGRRK